MKPGWLSHPGFCRIFVENLYFLWYTHAKREKSEAMSVKPEGKYDIFISYRRDGGQETARILRDSLAERGYRVFFDVESLRSGAFNTKL